MRLLKPPTPLALAPGERSVFLAGSIEQGRAAHWQDDLAARLADLDAALLNPRRDAWDATWTQSIDNPEFRTQVEWELAGLEQATLIAFYFDPATKAPITLLELGLHVHSGKILVCCPEGYFRRGNVEIVCHRYGAELVPDLAALAARIRARLHGE